MRRWAAGAAVLLTVLAGCAQPEVRSHAHASVTVDDKDQGKLLTISCNQFQSSWFLDITDANASAKAIVDMNGDKASVETVEIRGFNGFTGSYWQGGTGTADAKLMNQTFTITGTADGMKAGETKPGTATFTITARC
ncbi:MAG: lipoprotein LpqH [Mycobacteriaceae bacterium]|nr:lipoprotein LpqH [Mycobacteriaceae bacterium]MBV9516416.1 lipoprotein LpqH [Mycobacteriaceae bacterium]